MRQGAPDDALHARIRRTHTIAQPLGGATELVADETLWPLSET